MHEPISPEEYKKLPPLSNAEPRELAEEIHRILYDKKGRNIKVLHVEDKTVIAEYFVLCSGTSSTQVKSLGGEVEYKIGLRGLHPMGVEGRGNGSWVLIDYGAVIVHIFSREAREFYNLDKLYGDFPSGADDADTYGDDNSVEQVNENEDIDGGEENGSGADEDSAGELFQTYNK